jgi:hypothetical protein
MYFMLATCSALQLILKEDTYLGEDLLPLEFVELGY